MPSVLRSMMVIQGIDRSTEAKRETETEGCSETIVAGGAVISVIALWYWRFQWVLAAMVIEGVDRFTEAKGDTATEGCSETLATGGAAEFDGGS